MTTHREPDPEGDAADAPIDPLTSICSSCGGPLDEDGDCEDPLCPRSPYHLDEDDEDEWDEPDYPEGALGEGDKDA